MRKIPASVSGIALSFLVILSLSIGLHQSAERMAGRRISAGGPIASAETGLSFEKKETETAFDLSYGWGDFSDKRLEASFSITKSSLRDAEEEFGYREPELRSHVQAVSGQLQEQTAARLRDFAAGLIAGSKYSQYFHLELADAVSFNLKLVVPSDLGGRVKPEFERIKSRLAQEQKAWLDRDRQELDRSRKAYLGERGLRVIRDQVAIDYGLCIRRNKPRVLTALESMKSRGVQSRSNQFLGTVLSFVQQIRYGLPPQTEGDKRILEFWVPPRVLVDNLGDCDSKGVTFASLWLGYKKFPLLVIKMPKHMIIGVAVPSFSGEGITLNGVRYTLLEVAGPEKIPPGLLSSYSELYLAGGRYTYEMVD